MSFMDALGNYMNEARTLNNAKAYSTTKSSVLDFFSLGGAVRNMADDEMLSLFARAMGEDQVLALKCMFYFRDVRGGQGQREPFRKQLRFLQSVNGGEYVKRLLGLIPYYGRWDDVICLLFSDQAKQTSQLIMNMISAQLSSDMNTASDGRPISLLAKWLPSENASSSETKARAAFIRKSLGLSERQYRKMLSKLRAHIDIVERRISQSDWAGINYSHVPSKAMLRYKEAFRKHDETRFNEFTAKAVTGEAKINAGTLYPHEIVKQIMTSNPDPNATRALWNALPNYMGDGHHNAIAVVDVSGSMFSGCSGAEPIYVAISLGMYFAERNKGVYHNKFITFSERPEIQDIKGGDIFQKAQCLEKADWGYNTNIEKVFKVILMTARQSNTPAPEMVKRIFIISDMEFDQCTEGDKTPFEAIKQEFNYYGYELPQLVFWNVNATHKQFPMTMTDAGVQLVSGFSPSILKHTLKGEFVTAYDLMVNVLNTERYQLVGEALMGMDKAA